MNSIQNTACLIAAYETAAGLPDSERITRTDDTWRPGVTEQQAASLYRQAQALLAPETKLLSTSRGALIGQMRAETLPSVAASSSPLTRNAKPAPYRDVFSRWTMFPFTMYWGGMIWTCMRLTTASPVSSL